MRITNDLDRNVAGQAARKAKSETESVSHATEEK